MTGLHASVLRAAARRRAHAGFTLLELAIVVCVVGLLASYVLDRLWRYQEMAEKSAMEQTVSLLRSALLIETARLMARGREGEIEGLARTNPMTWLAQRPDNYAGEFDGSEPEGRTGVWYYDTRSHELVYLPQRSDHLQPDREGRKRLRYSVTVVGESLRRDVDVRSLWAAVLAPVESYGWFVDS